MLHRLAFVALLLISSSGTAQNSTTDCSRFLGNLHCTTNAEPGLILSPPPDYARMMQEGAQMVQQPARMSQDWAATAAANAAYMQRKREEKIVKAANAAIASDTAIAQPLPADEKPVLLSCTVNGKFAGTLALYERHGRLDATSDDGVTKTREAIFTPAAVSWVSPLWRSSLSRLDGSYVSHGNIPQIEGESVNGTCTVVSARKF